MGFLFPFTILLLPNHPLFLIPVIYKVHIYFPLMDFAPSLRIYFGDIVGFPQAFNSPLISLLLRCPRLIRLLTYLSNFSCLLR
ncbi:hypothetical protein BDV29DRAFT_177995 [Aspergillus leporis]|uniref:Uncharacterized protein n=1 Tax=Aspergillus leporis TaxID=41062 RepID=A0A5N5WWQ0_9EURO|nr:hypothetical protein BDV29DRAFT_177995 [Aspergillus leporis]